MTVIATHEREPGSVGVIEGSDFLPAELGLVAGNFVINEHTDAHGLCAVCGSAWPCERTEFAGFDF